MLYLRQDILISLNKKTAMKKANKGFTLIELLIVIAIIGLLATLAIVSLTSAQRRARDTKRVADLKSIQTGLELYWNENASYPTDPATWAALSDDLDEYMGTLPTDPEHDDKAYFYVTDLMDKDAEGVPNDEVYWLGATLENNDHQSLSQGDSTAFAAGAMTAASQRIDSIGTAIQEGASTTFDCSVAGVYCIYGVATTK